MAIYKWLFLTRGLRKRGAGIRESGAFLISKTGSKRISKIVFYDEVDPNAFETGIIELNGLAHGKLGKILEAYNGEVIADVHTHPVGCSIRQSVSDKNHPMSRIKGHIAFIAPDFALNKFLMPQKCAAYLYEGSFKWRQLQSKEFPLKLTLI